MPIPDAYIEIIILASSLLKYEKNMFLIIYFLKKNTFVDQPKIRFSILCLPSRYI